MGCSGRFWAVKTCRDDRMHVALTRLRPGDCFISVIGHMSAKAAQRS